MINRCTPRSTPQSPLHTFDGGRLLTGLGSNASYAPISNPHTPESQSVPRSTFVQNQLGGMIQFFAPVASPERLQSILAACSSDARLKNTAATLIDNGQYQQLIALLDTATNLPPSCAADLRLMTEAIASEQGKPIATPTPSAASLREVFNAPTCIVSCWQDIQPGVTTTNQLENILVQKGIEYKTVEPYQGVTEIAWAPEITPYLYRHNEDYGVTVILVNGVVAEILIPVKISLQQIIQEYGAPTIANESADGQNTRIVYPAYGLYFESSTDYGRQYAWLAHVVGNDDLTAFFSGISSNIKDCSLYSTNGCILATATPMP